MKKISREESLLLQSWHKSLRSAGLLDKIKRTRVFFENAGIPFFEIACGSVSAKLQSAKDAKPFFVRLNLKPLDELFWRSIFSEGGKSAGVLAELFSGKFPSPSFEMNAVQGGAIFPESSKDLELFCSCGSDAGFCRHKGMLFLKFEESFEKDLALFYKFRGMPEELLRLSDSALSKSVQHPEWHNQISGEAAFWGSKKTLEDLTSQLLHLRVPNRREWLQRSAPFQIGGENGAEVFKKINAAVAEEAERRLRQKI